MKYLVIILRFIKGYVVFKAEKGFMERFINLCTKNRIHIWNVTIEDNILTACVSIHHFKKIRSVVKRSGVKITIVKKVGLIFKYKQYNNRIGLAVGLMIFGIFHLIMSQFVWCFDVKGNELISKEEILKCAEYQGLTFGTYKKNFDEVRAARDIASQYDGEIPWLSINIKGSMAIIELRENNKIISDLEGNSPCNIIADFDGVILSIETYRGDAEVTVGSGIKKGDMLINGVIVNEDLSTSYYKAKGKITALRNKSVTINKSVNSGHTNLIIDDIFYNIGIFGLDIPFGIFTEKEDYNLFSDTRYIKINGYKLPFYVIKNTVVISENTENFQDKTYITASECFNFKNYNQNKNSTVISKTEDFSINKGSYIYTGEYTLIDFIGEEKLILSDNSK